MASAQPLQTLMAIATNLTQSLSSTERYQQLLEGIHHLMPCDASAILKLEGEHLSPVATHGLSPDTMGRRFNANSHPRLSAIMQSTEIVRFEHDSQMPDPYDGLVLNHEGALSVHDCLGASLYVQNRLWGVLTMDSLHIGRFDEIDEDTLQGLVSLTAATVKIVQLLDALEQQLDQQKSLTNAMITEQFKHHHNDMIGDSSIMQQLRVDISSVASTNMTVLITGETGTGKELVAREIHRHSPRADQALVYVNCAALPENLVESELFGHMKGAFSGAISQRAGKFELADRGSLFLDEIGEIPLAVQAKLLRALQFGEIQRVGADNTLRMDVRIIAATNRDLLEEVKEGRFRADLYHRLCVYPIEVPALRKRESDVIALAGYFLEEIRCQLGIQSLRLSESARPVLQQYAWPGNVRELEHTLSRAALRARQHQMAEKIVTISTTELALESQVQVHSDEVNPKVLIETQLSLAQATDEFQRQLVEYRVEQANNNWSQAANSLDMNRSNLHRLAKRLGLK